jgi:hypothetical protein
MKKTLLMAGALLALTAGVASAQAGLNLSWTDCGALGTSSRTYACTSNSGSGNMVGSAILGLSLGNAVGNESVFDLQTNQAALSPWWTYGTGQCRLATHFQASYAGIGSCENPWINAGFSTYNYTAGFNGPNRARMRTVWGMNPGGPVDGATELYMLHLVLSNARSSGLGACAGCLDGACIVFNSTKVQEPAGGGSVTVSGPIERDYVTYQAGGGLGGQCPGVTPTTTQTWGSVKSLYR